MVFRFLNFARIYYFSQRKYVLTFIRIDQHSIVIKINNHNFKLQEIDELLMIFL